MSVWLRFGPLKVPSLGCRFRFLEGGEVACCDWAILELGKLRWLKRTCKSKQECECKDLTMTDSARFRERLAPHNLLSQKRI